MRIKRKDLVEALEVAKKFTATDFFGAANVWFDTENRKIVACDLTLSAEVELNMEDVYTAIPEATTEWPEEDFRPDLMSLKKSQLENLAEYMGIQVVGTKNEMVKTIIRESMIAADEALGKLVLEPIMESFTVDPCLLLKAVRALETDEVEIKGDEYRQDGNFWVPDILEIHGYYEAVSTISPMNFPEMDLESKGVEKFVCDLFYNDLVFLGKVRSDPGDMRDHINNVCFAKSEIVSTDGGRLHLVRKDSDVLEENTFCVKKKILQKLLPIAKNGRIQVYADIGRSVKFISEDGKTKITMRWQDIPFPDYKPLLENYSIHKSVTIKEDTWKQMLAQANVLTDTDHSGIVLKFNSGITVNSYNPEKGVYTRSFAYAEGTDEIDPPVEIALNGSFLKDLPTHDPMTITLSDDTVLPVFVGIDDTKLAIIMPMRT
jgi:hypothetical protein